MAPKVSPLLFYAFLFLSLFFSQISSSPSAFDFINQLQGSKKGDRVKGLYNLKKYLKTFGYINDLSYNSSSPDADYFSDQLESAIRTYQTRHHLNSTGILDADTARQMMKPRCGVADIINGTSGGAGVVPHYRFLPGEPKWPADKRRLTFGFAPGTPDKFFFPVTTALRNWESVGPFMFYKFRYANADIKFTLFRGDHGDGKPFDGPGGSYAHAFPPTNGNCHFDADENWAEFGPPHNGLDIQSVALHEIGHLLGLGHSEHHDAVMWEEFEYGEKRRVLTTDDKNGLKALYNF